MGLRLKKYGKTYDLSVKIARYGNGSLAIVLKEGWETFSNLTVNLEAYDVTPEDSFAAFVDAEGLGFDIVVNFIKENNLGTFTGRGLEAGDIVFPEVLFNKEKLKELDTEGFEEYEAYAEALAFVKS